MNHLEAQVSCTLLSLLVSMCGTRDIPEITFGKTTDIPEHMLFMNNATKHIETMQRTMQLFLFFEHITLPDSFVCKQQYFPKALIY